MYLTPTPTPNIKMVEYCYHQYKLQMQSDMVQPECSILTGQVQT